MASALETVPASPAQKYSIAEIRAKLREQLTSIHSIWCEYRVQWRGEYERDQPTTWPTFVWAQQGPRMLHRVLPHQPKRLNGAWLEEFHSFDGRKGYQVIFDASEKSSQLLVQRFSSPPPDLPGHLIPAQSLGLFIQGSTSNLASLIQRPDLVAVSGFPVDGHQCVLVDLGTCDFNGVTSNQLRVFLDPKFDFLPRMIESLPKRLLADLKQNSLKSQKAAAVPKYEAQLGDVIWQIGIDSFIEVEDPALGRKRWFPQRLTHSGQVTAFVESVRLNVEISSAEFQPSFHKGVKIIDDPGTPRMRESIHGRPSRTSVGDSGEDLDSEEGETNSGKPVVAELSSGVSLGTLFVLIAFGLLTLAIGIARRRV